MSSKTRGEMEIDDLGEPELCLVAEADDRVVGFILGTTSTKRRSAWKHGYLVWMGVAPEVQRRGLAVRLYRAFAAHRELQLLG
jgi:ribosomal protein S18 acetylase RimI-like enzyme